MCAGRKLNAEAIDPARKMFSELLYESAEFHSQGGEPSASVGDFIRSRVHFSQWPQAVCLSSSSAAR